MPDVHRHSLTIAGDDAALVALLRTAIARHWPGSDVPAIDLLRLEEFASLVLIGGEGGAERLPGPVLAVFGNDASAAPALAGALRQMMTPGVFLIDEPGESAADLQGEGVLVERTDAEPARLAGELYALCERQGAVDSLRREVRILTSARAGAGGVFDRLQAELNMAALVQRDALPKALPEAEGLDFGVLFRPASYVSGDIYDLTRLDDRTIGFFIADCVGHGVPAALLTMVIAKSLRPLDGARVVPPGEAMGRLNEDMIRAQRGATRFATAIYGTVDVPTRRVTVACAGHPAPLLVGRGAIRPVAVEGPLLGVFRNETFREASFILEDHQTLVVYSDGFETAFPDEGDDPTRFKRGTKNYVARLTGLPWPGHGAASLADTFLALAGVLDEQAGSLHQIDDLTAIAISGRGAGAARANAA